MRWVASILFVCLAGAGVGLYLRPARQAEPARGGNPKGATAPTPMVLGSTRAVAPVVASPAQSPATLARASAWRLADKPRVNAFQFGGDGKEEICDMAVRGDGRIVVAGMSTARDIAPTGVRTHNLMDSQSGAEYGFVAEFSADGQRMNWMAIFGGDLIRPNRIALGPDGTIALGGKVLTRLPGASRQEFTNREGAVIKISADGSRVEWVRAVGPNGAEVTGLAVDAKGRVVYVGGTRGKGQKAYILRKEANGDDSPFTGRGARSWAIDFDVRDEEFLREGQVGAFYQKGRNSAGYDYDGPSGKWGPVRFSIDGIRQNGRVIVLPDGDIVASGTLQYDFREGANKSFPAFDLIVARFSEDGRLKWSTNLYQAGDSVHTPDQKDKDLLYNPVNGDIYVAAIQHGSNVYRLKGDLRGDTGNMMIGWVGQVDGRTGQIKNGWYWMNSRNTGYDAQGRPTSPPHPKLAGNSPERLGVDSEGRVYLAGNAGALAWTSPHAWRDWPSSQQGGSNAALIVLSPNLDQVHFTTMIRGTEGGKATARTLAVTANGVWVAGANSGPGFPEGAIPAWANPSPKGGADATLVQFLFP